MTTDQPPEARIIELQQVSKASATLRAAGKRLTLGELRDFVAILNKLEAGNDSIITASITWGGAIKSISAKPTNPMSNTSILGWYVHEDPQRRAILPWYHPALIFAGTGYRL